MGVRRRGQEGALAKGLLPKTLNYELIIKYLIKIRVGTIILKNIQKITEIFLVGQNIMTFSDCFVKISIFLVLLGK